MQRLADRIRLIGINVGDDRACSCRRFAGLSRKVNPPAEARRGRKRKKLELDKEIGAAGDSRDYAGGVFAVYSAAGRVPP